MEEEEQEKERGHGMSGEKENYYRVRVINRKKFHAESGHHVKLLKQRVHVARGAHVVETHIT
jgi:hypothetical protein